MKSPFPQFKGEHEDVVRKCILWTWARLRKVRWENDRVRKRAYQETPEQMIRNRTIFYMNPCALQTITCALALKRNGIEPTMNIDLFEKQGKMEIPHFSLEFPIHGKLHHVDFRSHETLFNEGPAPVMGSMGKHTHLGREQVESSHIRGDKTILEQIMGHPAGRKLVEKGYRLEEHLDRLTKDNHVDTFKTFDARARRLRRTYGLITGKGTRRT